MQNHFNRRKLYKAVKKMQYKITTCTEALTEIFRKPLLQIIFITLVKAYILNFLFHLCSTYLRYFSPSCNIIYVCTYLFEVCISPQVVKLFVFNLFEALFVLNCFEVILLKL